MGVYQSTEQMFAVIGMAWRSAFQNPTVREKFVALGVFVQFKIHEPEADLWLLGDGTVHEGAYTCTPDKPVVSMEMTANVAHRFWLDQLNVTLATAKGEIKAKGPITKIFGLIPLVKPVKALYPSLCAQHGVKA